MDRARLTGSARPAADARSDVRPAADSFDRAYGLGVESELDSRLLSVYQFAVGHPAMTRAQLLAEGLSVEMVDLDLDELKALGLIKAGTLPGTWDAMPPDVALTKVAGRLERRASNTRALAYELSLTYQQVRATYASDGHGMRRLGSMQELDNAVEDLTTKAEGELRSLRNPSPRTSLTFQSDLTEHRQRLMSPDGHPVRSRCVYDARTLQLPNGEAVVLARAEAGEEARFLTPLPISVTIADDEIAVLDLTSYDSSGIGSMVVTERRLVAALTGVVDSYWQLAAPMAGPLMDELDERYSQVLRLLAMGSTDAVIAEQLGISQRTVERRIRALLDQLGVTTRFQAGVQAARRGWLENRP